MSFPLFVIKELRDEQKAHLKTETEKSKAVGELKGVRSRLEQDYNKLVINYNKLKGEHEAAVILVDEAQEKLKEKMDTMRGMLDIREGTRGKPLGRPFVQHCRTLLATGATARSTREQLLLNGHFFIAEDYLPYFTEQVPELRWFQFQREGLGLESMVLTFIRLAKAERVAQWGFDETSLDGVATLNQWCRIEENDMPVLITIECARLLPGSTSAKVVQHIKATWKRGAEVVAMVREALGERADELVPLLHGGVHVSKLNGSMHDTCNTANLVAQKVCLSCTL